MPISYVSYTALRHYVKLPKKPFTYKEAEEATGLSRATLRTYLEGDYVNAHLIVKEKIKGKVFFKRTDNSSDEKEIAKRLLREGVRLIGEIPEEVFETCTL